jgi:Fe-S cluster assembly protein SufD
MMNALVPNYIEAISRQEKEPCATLEERIHALELARKASVPSVLEEDWRKTDPNGFPWDQIESVDSDQTSRQIQLKSFEGIQTLEPQGKDAGLVHDMLMISGDDYDAKFLYYHKALSRDAACLRVPKNFSGSPAELIQNASGPGLASFTTIIVVESGSEATLYDRWESFDVSPVVVGRTVIRVADGAKLTYIQEDSFSKTASIYRRARIQLARDSTLNWISMTSGAAWHVARLEVDMQESGSEAHLYGLYAGAGDSLADHRTLQYHAAPRTVSNLLFKALLAGRARSVYQGLIEVPKEAQKTDAYQKCRNLLLDHGTHADAIPKLEIIADDVRCSHGASMGTVNADQLFYLQSRGLTKRQAISAIATGFAEEVIRQLPIESVQERWRDVVRNTILSSVG